MLAESGMCPVDRRMPSEIMDQRHLCMASTSSSFFSDKIDLMSERKVGFWKQSSLPSYRVKTPTSDVMYMHFVTPDGSNIREDGPLESLEEIEIQTVGNLLPDEDELFSGIIDDIEHDFQPKNAATQEYALFCSEVELEADESLISNKILSPASGACLYHHETPGAPFLMEHVYVDHPTRMLLVRNIDRKVEVYELRTLFEQFGDIHTLDTSFKDHGFVTMSYYDVRSSCNAMNALQSRQLKQRKLYIQFIIPKDNQSESCRKQGMLMLFNLDASISNDDLHQMFGIYGDIKEIHETPHQRQHKSVEFYDVRAAEDALCALSKDETRQKHVKHECNNPGGSGRCGMQQLSSNLRQAEIDVCHEETYPSRSLPFEYAPVDLGVIMSYNNDEEPLPDVQSTTHAPYNPIVNSKFGEILSNTQHQLAMRNRNSPVSKYFSQIEANELSNSVRKVNLGSDCISTPYSHSLSRYHDDMPGIPLSSPSTLSPASININFRSPQAVDDTLIYTADSRQPKNLPYEYENSGAFGTKENRSCPPYTPQCFWGNSNLHYGSQEQTTWPDPSLFNISAPLAQIHGLPRTSSPMLSTVRPLHRHHVGSAPCFSHSLWYRRHAYAVDAANGSKSHPGALGSMSYSGCPTPHLPKLTSPNIFPRRGNSIDALISPHLGLASLQQKCHMFHGRTSPTLLPSSYDANDRVRSRISDANPNHADNKKQYELDIERIIREEDSRTTLMIKNIPNKYTSKMLLAAIDEHHRGTYDFIYLPIDFKNKCNVGYAFINMTDPQQIIPFYKTFNGKKWERFNSEKVVSLAYARIQGKAALISHFQNSSLMNEDKRCRPIIFHTDGPNAGDQCYTTIAECSKTYTVGSASSFLSTQEPFPTGVNVRSKPGRPRTSSSSRRRDTHQRSPPSTPSSSSSSGGGEVESSGGADSSPSSPE